MKIKRKTILNLLLIAFVVSFFVTPLGYYSKVWLNTLFAAAPKIVAEKNREQILDYDWKLKDEDWAFINFNRSKGKVVFINFWASWRLPSAAELKGIQKLYDRYADKVDFYIITNEERSPVQEFMEKNDFTFPVTYLIIGEPTPVSVMEPPASYLIDKNGYVVIKQEDISDWNSPKIDALIDGLLAE
ncbi:MAG: TlpA disulfide reductase family protein [Flavobacteriaceae bacterium]